LADSQQTRLTVCEAILQNITYASLLCIYYQPELYDQLSEYIRNRIVGIAAANSEES